MRALTHREVERARQMMGWTYSQMADALDLKSISGRDTVRAWCTDPSQSRARQISGPAALALVALLSGFKPPSDETLDSMFTP